MSFEITAHNFLASDSLVKTKKKKKQFRNLFIYSLLITRKNGIRDASHPKVPHPIRHLNPISGESIGTLPVSSYEFSISIRLPPRYGTHENNFRYWKICSLCTSFMSIRPSEEPFSPDGLFFGFLFAISIIFVGSDSA